MKFALHAGTVRHTNLAMDIGTARRAGFEGVELFLPKVARYLDAGFDAADLRQMLGPFDVTMIDFLMPIESLDPDVRARVDGECERMAQVAQVIGCQAIQVVALNEFSSSSWTDQKAVLVSRLRELSEISRTRSPEQRLALSRGGRGLGRCNRLRANSRHVGFGSRKSPSSRARRSATSPCPRDVQALCVHTGCQRDRAVQNTKR